MNEEDRNQDDQCSYKIDNLGRLRVICPRTGPLQVVNRALKFHSTTAQSHANDLYMILQEAVGEDKYAISMVTDNGPDYNMKSTISIICFGRLWRDLNLDLFVQTSYAAGHSAKNIVEHAWAPLSRSLAGAILPIRQTSMPTNWPQQGGVAREGSNCVRQCRRHPGRLLALEEVRWLPHHLPQGRMPSRSRTIL